MTPPEAARHTAARPRPHPRAATGRGAARARLEERMLAVLYDWLKAVHVLMAVIWVVLDV